jgi:hypothetical protein
MAFWPTFSFNPNEAIRPSEPLQVSYHNGLVRVIADNRECPLSGKELAQLTDRKGQQETVEVENSMPES